MAPYIVKGPADLDGLVGKELGPSPWLTITQPMIDQFADLTRDHQWIHVDVDRSRLESPFGTTIAHGFLTLAMLPAMQDQIIAFEGFERVLNYGLDRMRCPTPVPVDRRVRLTQTVAGVERIDDTTTRIMLESAIWVEDEAKPAIAARLIAQLYAPAPTA